jgi:ABC-type hemin transport system substrate-binding protein
VRVVSLVPSVTETLLAWGVDVVACTRFCEQPALRHVGGTKDPDVAAIVTLAPDLVVVDQEENRKDDADALAAAGLALHVTAVRSLDDVGPTLNDLRAALALPTDTDPLTSPVVNSAIQRAHGSVGVGATVERRAFVPIWRRPWMTLSDDTYGSSLLAALGIVNVFGGHPDRYPTVDLDEVAVRRPALVLLPSEPYPFAERHLAELHAALPDAVIELVDGQDLFWWGVRTPDAMRRLADQLTGSRPA